MRGWGLQRIRALLRKDLRDISRLRGVFTEWSKSFKGTSGLGLAWEKSAGRRAKRLEKKIVQWE
jgi:hypothetical protein